MKKLFIYLLGIITAISVVYAGFEAINNITATGTITSSGDMISTNGMMRQAVVRHAYGWFQLQSTTIDITAQSWWKMITNVSWNLWTGLEAYWMTLSWDIMTIINTGDYFGMLTISVSWPNQDDVCIRLFNITSSGQVWYFICGTTLWAANFMPLTLPLYIENNGNNQFKMEIANITNNADVNVRSSVFYMSYLHD